MRVAVCSTNRLLAESIARVLSHEPEFSVEVGTSIRQVERSAAAPTIVIVDGGGLSAFDAQFLIGAETFGSIRPIILGSFPFPYEPFEPFVSYDAPLEELVRRVKEATGPPEPVRVRRPRMCNNPLALSVREYEVAHLISCGLSNRKIAETLAIKEITVMSIVSRVLNKLRLDNRTQIAIEVLRTEEESSGAKS